MLNTSALISLITSNTLAAMSRLPARGWGPGHQLGGELLAPGACYLYGVDDAVRQTRQLARHATHSVPHAVPDLAQVGPRRVDGAADALPPPRPPGIPPKQLRTRDAAAAVVLRQVLLRLKLRKDAVRSY